MNIKKIRQDTKKFKTKMPFRSCFEFAFLILKEV